MNIDDRAYFAVIYDEDANVIDVQPAREGVEVKFLGPLLDNPIEINAIKITEVMMYTPKRRNIRSKKRRCKQVHSGCQLWEICY